jgi:hypothetical protein
MTHRLSCALLAIVAAVGFGGGGYWYGRTSTEQSSPEISFDLVTYQGIVYAGAILRVASELRQGNPAQSIQSLEELVGSHLRSLQFEKLPGTRMSGPGWERQRTLIREYQAKYPANALGISDNPRVREALSKSE